MIEVYRARDAKLDRDVAINPPSRFNLIALAAAGHGAGRRHSRLLGRRPRRWWDGQS